MASMLKTSTNLLFFFISTPVNKHRPSEAKLLNTKAPVIGRYEREEATPSVEVALKLANILGVSLDYLTGNTDLELDQSTLKRIEDISKMSNDDRSFVLRAIDALIRDFNAQKAYTS